MTDTTITARRLGPADEALLAAEREIAELKQKQADLRAAGDDGDHDEITDRISDLETLICNIPPNSLTGAVIKLRQLVDDIDASSHAEGNDQAVRQILAVVERSIAPAPAPCAATDTPSFEEMDDRDALTRLEDELIHIEGLASCLMLIGKSRYNDEAFGYLGGQLHAHHEAAREAFDEVFEASKQKPTEGDAA